MGYVAVGAVVIGANWVLFIWGVNNGHVVEVSLGYFINPLVTILLGVLVMGERLRPLQWAALAVALVAVVQLTLDYGALPWLALALAASFGTYGLMKKKAAIGAVEGLALETALLVPLAGVTWSSCTRARVGRSGRTGGRTRCCWRGPGWSPSCRCCCSAARRRGCRWRRWGCSSTSRRACSSSSGSWCSTSR
ncbi:EamA family transporter [Actinokineospora soli]|uniref:EamA family transporter n=1 Tax=Actinokineospora soli TaxID=1048753 RepID=A0ABW2U0A4_9PSEU